MKLFCANSLGREFSLGTTLCFPLQVRGLKLVTEMSADTFALAGQSILLFAAK